MCHTCGQKATEFHECGQELELRHLPLCGRQVILRLRPKRYRCRYCAGAVTTPERAEWYDAKAGCTKTWFVPRNFLKKAKESRQNKLSI
jgi:transposase